MSLPKPITSKGKLGVWLEGLRKQVKSQRIVQGSWYGVQETALGTTLIRRDGVRVSGSELTVKGAIVQTIYGDYLKCLFEEVPTEQGGSNFNTVWVAKPRVLRASQNGGTAGTNLQTRTRTQSVICGQGQVALSISESVYPLYMSTGTGIGDVEAARIQIALARPRNLSTSSTSPGFGTGIRNPDDPTQWIEWVDLNVEARHWRLELQPVTMCLDGEVHKALGALGEPKLCEE